MRIIDGDALKEKIMQSLKACEEWQNDCSALLNTTDYYRAKQGVQTFQMCIAFLENQPTIEERRNGEWIVAEDGMIHCTVCEKIPTNKIMDRVKTLYYINPLNMNFCPNCGADMRGEQDD